MDSVVRSELTILRRQIFQLVEPAQLQWLDGPRLKQPATQSWIYDNLFNTDKIAHLPPQRYQLRVLKLLISKIEKSIEDPEEDVCNPSPRHILLNSITGWLASYSCGNQTIFAPPIANACASLFID
jgi:hypothetical protein